LKITTLFLKSLNIYQEKKGTIAKVLKC